MSAQWREISVPLGGGLDTKTDEKLVTAPKVIDLRNAVFTESPGYKKRNGYNVLGTLNYSTAAALSNMVAIATRNGNELLGFDDEYLYSYETRQGRWIPRGRCTGVKATERSESLKITNQTTADTVTHNDLRCTAWTDSSDSIIHYSLIDATSGSVYTADASISGGTRPKLVAAGNDILLFYYKAADTSLRCKVINTATPSSVTDGTLALTDVSSKVAFDATTAHDGGAALVAYIRNNAGNNETVAFYVLPNGVKATNLDTQDYSAEAVLDTSADSDADSLAVSTGSTYIWVANADSGGNIAAMRNPIELLAASVVKDVKVTATAGPIAVQVDMVTETKAWVFHNTTNPGRVNICQADSSGTLPAGTNLYGFNVASGAFWYRGHAYCNVVRDSILQSSYFLVSDDGRTVIAKTVHNQAQGVPSVSPCIPNVHKVNGASDVYSWAGIFRARLNTSGEAANDTKSEIYADTGIKVVTFDFSAPDRYRFAEVGGSTYISGGIVWQYDGYDVSPASLLLYPEPANITFAQGTAGALTQTGVYWYRNYFEKIRKNGDRLKSSAIADADLAVDPDGILTGTNDEITETIETYGFDADVFITAYRTAANPDITGGSQFYRVSSTDPASSTPNDFIENSVAAASVTFNDRMSDATLVDNELDYLGSGELDNIDPPACSVLVSGKGRVFMAGYEDGSLVRFSKLRFPGQPLEFNDALTVQCPDAGGAITGLAILDQFVVVFKQDQIYLFSGPGPNNLGQGTFSDVQLVTSDVGCSNQLGIVETPLGVMFPSDKGIYLLGRDTSVKYIGADVEGYNATMDIRAATLVSDQNQVRFLDASGRTLVFDYLFGQWTTFTNHEGLSAVNWSDRYTYLRDDNKVYQEDPELSTDAGAFYQLRVKLGWVKPHGNQGYGRVRKAFLLGDYQSTHTLKYKFRYDYESRSDTGTFDPSTIVNTNTYGSGTYGYGVYSGEGGTVYQFEAPLPRQKLSTLQIEFWDVPGTDIGPSYQVTDLTLEVATKKGPNKMESGRTSGATGPSTV